MPTELAPGVVLGGKYELEKPLGEGGMGAVWLARNNKTKKRVALKLLKRGAAAAQGKRLLREARAAGVISHPNVREIFDVMEDEDGAPIIVMEFLEGRPLGALLAGGEKLSLERTAEILVPVISAVGTAHTLGIVHRDLKPDNIFLVEHPAPCVKVVDFGIAKLTAEQGDAAATAALTGTGSIVGTPHYMAPEQVFGEKNLDYRVDVWALGLIAYRMLSGVLPTDADNVGQTMKIIVSKGIAPLASVAPHVPADVSALVDRMLQRSTRARLSNLAEAFDVLKRYTECDAPRFTDPRSRSSDELSSEGSTTIGEAVDPHTFTHVPEPGQTRPGRARWVGVAAIGALAVAVGVFFLARGESGAQASSVGPSSSQAPSAPVTSSAKPDERPGAASAQPVATVTATASATSAPEATASPTAEATATSNEPSSTGKPRGTSKPRSSPEPATTSAAPAATATTTLTVQTAW